LTVYLYAVALLGGLAGLKLCSLAVGQKSLNFCRRNNHAGWSRRVLGLQTGCESTINTPTTLWHTYCFSNAIDILQICNCCWQQSMQAWSKLNRGRVLLINECGL